MRRSIYIPCLMIGLWAALFLPIQAQDFETYPDDPIGVKKAVLENGFSVYLVEDHSRPVVFGAVAVKAGGKNDPKDATGMAHYLEHMLFKGTKSLGTTNYEQEKTYLTRIDSLYEKLGQTVDAEQRKAIQTQINENAVAAAAFAIPNEFDRMLAAIGSTGLNAFTTEEMTVYHNSFPPNQVEKWMDIYAHRFQEPVFRLFQSELETVYEEKNRAMDNFGYALFRAFSRQLYKNHPYGQQDVIGETDHLKNPSLIKMYQYFNTYYVANNMALVLSGDFDADEVMPLVRAKFGKLPRRDVPVFPKYPEAELKGREYIKGRYTPVKAGLAAFRTVPIGHPDEAIIDVMNEILSNDGQTGFLDQLLLDQQVLLTEILPLAHIDHSASLLIIVPKLVGQSVKSAEAKVMGEIRRLRLGDFEDWQIAAAKERLKMNFIREMEDNTAKALLVVNAFAENRSWADYARYPKAVEAVTREKVVAAANKYYNENYLFLESRMGFPKKEKLEKPGYQPPLPPADAKSSYARYFETLPELAPVARFVDFEKDMQTSKVANNVALYHVQNPLNDIFRLNLRFGKGNLSDPRIAQLTRYIDVLGTDSLSVKELKKAYGMIGSTYLISSSNNHFEIELSGWDAQLLPTLRLTAHLLDRIHGEASKVDILVREEKTNRRLSEKDVQEIGHAMSEYVKYGEQSSFLNRLSIKELESLSGDTLLKVFRDVLDHACEVHYTGRIPAPEVADALRQTVFAKQAPRQAAVYVPKELQPLGNRMVYFLDRKDALQSQLYFVKDVGEFKKEEAWLIDAFNEYFGGSMSALVFQEIREFRSLAYTATAPVRAPEQAGGHVFLDGYIGCQADKTSEALRVMHWLIDSVPGKAERIDAIRKAVIQSAYTERPGFRQLSQYVRAAQLRGYTEDPAAYRLRFYEGLSFERLMEWYAQHIASGTSDISTITVVTGDSRQIPMSDLLKYGEVTTLSMEEIFRN